MNIICVSNNNFAQHLGVMITSLLENTKAKGIVFFIVDGGLP